MATTVTYRTPDNDVQQRRYDTPNKAKRAAKEIAAQSWATEVTVWQDGVIGGIAIWRAE